MTKIWLIVSIVLVLLIATSILIGPMGFINLGQSLTESEKIVLLHIRLPRVFLALVVGSSLAVCGASIQSLFRNPLADPSLIGISGGAALFVGIYIVLFGSALSFTSFYGISLFAFLGAALSSLIIIYLARISGQSTVHILLAGIVINTLSGALTGLLSYLSDEQELRQLMLWTFGSLGNTLWLSIFAASSIIIPSTLYLIRKGALINTFVLGDESMSALGINPQAAKIKIILMVTICMGSAVAISGIIGFVGLLVPHMVRMMTNSHQRLFLPLSAAFGAIFLLAADTLSRTILSPAEIPVGITTSLIGAPFFIWLLLRFQVGANES